MGTKMMANAPTCPGVGTQACGGLGTFRGLGTYRGLGTFRRAGLGTHCGVSNARRTSRTGPDRQTGSGQTSLGISGVCRGSFSSSAGGDTLPPPNGHASETQPSRTSISGAYPCGRGHDQSRLTPTSWSAPLQLVPASQRVVPISQSLIEWSVPEDEPLQPLRARESIGPRCACRIHGSRRCRGSARPYRSTSMSSSRTHRCGAYSSAHSPRSRRRSTSAASADLSGCAFMSKYVCTILNGAPSPADFTAPEHIGIPGAYEPQVAASRLGPNPHRFQRLCVRPISHVDGDQAEDRAAHQPRGGETGSRVVHPPLPQRGRDLLQEFLPGAGSYMPPTNRMHGEVVRLEPGVQQSIEVRQPDEVLAPLFAALNEPRVLVNRNQSTYARGGQS